MDMTLRQWRSVTGENKVTADKALITLLGDRSGTWLDDVEQSEYAALEEPFAVIHKATLHAIKLERDRDAAPHAKTRRTAQQVYERAQRLVRRVVEMRWAEAQAADTGHKSKDGSCPTLAFRGKWEAPGFVALDAKRRVKLIFYMREETRKRWKRDVKTGKGCSREQEHAPPATIPSDTISIFTDGSAFYDKDAKAWTEAGFGLTAVTRGSGHEHKDGIILFDHYGPIQHGDLGAKQKTNNVAEIIAFIHALRWARQAPETLGKPIIMRYDSKYAALITTGVYKAKKNKELVATAQAEWKLTHAAKNGQLWMRHVPGHSQHTWNDRADCLANKGRDGDAYSGTPLAD